MGYRALVDAETIAACKSRKRKAFGDLYSQSVTYVLTIVRGYVDCEETRKDLIQDIYSKTFLAIDSYSPDKGAFKFWLRKIAVNQCLMHLRERNGKARIIELNGDLYQMPDRSEHSELNSFDPDFARHVLREMPEGYRRVFTMVVMNGYSHEEVGQELGITAETSRSQLTRSKKWLRGFLKTNKNAVNYGF